MGLSRSSKRPADKRLLAWRWARGSLVIGVGLAVLYVGQSLRSARIQRQHMEQARSLVDRLLSGPANTLDQRLQDLNAQRDVVAPVLDASVSRAEEGSPAWTRLTLAGNEITQADAQVLAERLALTDQANDLTLPDWAADALSNPFEEMARDAHVPVDQRQAAVRLWAECVPGNSEQLADILLEIGVDVDLDWLSPLEMQALLPALTRAAWLEEPDWQDTIQLDSWPQVPSGLRRKIETGYGILEDRFAIAFQLPWDRFDGLLHELSNYGYRPVRVEPYISGDVLSVAAVWQRDGRPWKVIAAVDEDDLKHKIKQQLDTGLYPVDLAGLQSWTGEDPGAAKWFATLSDSGTDPPPAHLLYIDAADHSRRSVMKSPGWKPLAFCALRRAEGDIAYSGLWHTGSVASASYFFRNRTEDQIREGSLVPVQDAFDIGLVTGWSGTTAEARLSEVVRQATQKLEVTPTNDSVRHDRAMANYQLGNNTEALDDLNQLVDKQLSPQDYATRAVLHARIGNTDDAVKDIDQASESGNWEQEGMLARSMVAALLGEHSQAYDELMKVRETATNDSEALYRLASSFSSMSAIVGGEDADTAESYRTEAVKLLEEAVEHGFDDIGRLPIDPAFEAARSSPTFSSLLEAHREPTYVIFTRSTDQYRCELIPACDLETHREKCDELMKAGFRPISLSAIQNSPDGQVVATSVWQEVSLSGIALDHWHRRRARAAAFLARLGEPEIAFDLLRNTENQNLQAHLANEVGRHVSASRLWAAFKEDQQTPTRHGLLMMLADSGAVNELPHALLEVINETLRQESMNTSSAGIRGAIRYFFETQSSADLTTSVDAPQPAESEWYQNSLNQSMVIIGNNEHAKDTDVSSESGADQAIGSTNRFAIAATETTLGQYQQFLTDHPEIRVPATWHLGDRQETRLPVAGVSWTEAAAYCIWLNRREGIPRDEWPYLPIDDDSLAAGVRVAPDPLIRSGYRLPTEAEWLEACRRGTTTSRFFGEDHGLLEHYAWYGANADLALHPIATRKPNSLGLFDMLGNVLEWCHDAEDESGDYVNGSHILNDSVTINSGQVHRILKGGSVTSPHEDVVVTMRTGLSEQMWLVHSGFRVARSMTEMVPTGEIDSPE